MFANDEPIHLIEADNCVTKGAVLEEANAHLRNETASIWENNLIKINNKTVRVGKNKLRTYRTFKSGFQTNMYLKKPIQRLALLRCGAAPL